MLIISASQSDKVAALEKVKNTKYIFVDEAQDLNATEYKFLCLLSELLNAKMSMVGDQKQSIYQMKNSSGKYFMDHLYDAV